jgi:hypothetical protein
MSFLIVYSSSLSISCPFSVFPTFLFLSFHLSLYFVNLSLLSSFLLPPSPSLIRYSYFTHPSSTVTITPHHTILQPILGDCIVLGEHPEPVSPQPPQTIGLGDISANGFPGNTVNSKTINSKTLNSRVECRL